ncbi:hypothetical protein BHE74_00019288 [Ensete ventricosum]|nr:hypothetical protein BHE74_00019288 [Ensete ventricosum]
MFIRVSTEEKERDDDRRLSHGWRGGDHGVPGVWITKWEFLKYAVIRSTCAYYYHVGHSYWTPPVVPVYRVTHAGNSGFLLVETWMRFRLLRPTATTSAAAGSFTTAVAVAVAVAVAISLPFFTLSALKETMATTTPRARLYRSRWTKHFPPRDQAISWRLTAGGWQFCWLQLFA